MPFEPKCFVAFLISSLGRVGWHTVTPNGVAFPDEVMGIGKVALLTGVLPFWDW